MPARRGVGIALLADPVRREIVGLIAERPRRPSALADLLGLSRPAISHHLRQLEEAGLIVRRVWLVDRRSTLFQLEPSKIRPILAWLAGTDVASSSKRRDPSGR